MPAAGGIRRTKRSAVPVWQATHGALSDFAAVASFSASLPASRDPPRLSRHAYRAADIEKPPVCHHGRLEF
jgi:hypothetical protein